jgi:hypothetical protein
MSRGIRSREQRSEVRSQGSESRGRKSNDRGQRAEVSWLFKNILAGLSHFFTGLASYPQYNLSSMA